jgi:hypothetical protein
MLLLLILVFVVPFVIVLWAVSLVAPLWVAIPFALLVALVLFLRLVKWH